MSKAKTADIWHKKQLQHSAYCSVFMYLRLTDVVRLRQQLDKQKNTINCNIAIANFTTSH